MPEWLEKEFENAEKTVQTWSEGKREAAGIHPDPNKLYTNSIGKQMPEISKTFSYHKPSPDGLNRITKLRAKYTELCDLIEALAPFSRERSTAITNLEQSAMWAIKSVVVNDPESEVPPA